MYLFCVYLKARNLSYTNRDNRNFFIIFRSHTNIGILNFCKFGTKFTQNPTKNLKTVILRCYNKSLFLKINFC